MTMPDPADTLSGNLPAVRPDTNPMPAIPSGLEWDDDSIALLRDPPDLRTAHYTDQVVAALHGNPDVFGLDPDVQAMIGNVARVFEHIARGIVAEHDPKTITRRAAVLLMTDPLGGTPMRCPDCGRIHHPVAGPLDTEVAGREDIACAACWKARPKHAAAKPAPGKPPVVKARAQVAGTSRRRPSSARRRTTGAA